MRPEIDYTLYLCTDRNVMTVDTVEEAVELAIKGGVTVVQLKEPDCTPKEFYELAESVKEVTDAYEIPLIIYSRADVALAVGADGVHLGVDDIPIHTARNLMGAERFVGATVSTVEEAVEAMKSGADYLRVGDIFGTTTRSNAKRISLEDVEEIKNAVSIPVVAAGGIKASNITELKPLGVDGAAVTAAVLGQKDITAAAQELLSSYQEA